MARRRRFDFVAWNKAAAKVCLEDLEKECPGNQKSDAKATFRRVIEGTGVLE